MRGARRLASARLALRTRSFRHVPRDRALQTAVRVPGDIVLYRACETLSLPVGLAPPPLPLSVFSGNIYELLVSFQLLCSSPSIICAGIDVSEARIHHPKF